jgi:hypothetical protein
MIFTQRGRRMTWANSIAGARDDVRQLVPQLSARDAAVVLGELDQIVAIPCPGKGIAGYFAMCDFQKEMDRFDWFLRAVKTGQRRNF